MSEVGLTETVHSGKGSDARKFELWLQGELIITWFKTLLLLIIHQLWLPDNWPTGRHEVWVLQAPARDVKETWITEIKRVLLNQFHQLKGQTIAQTSSSRTGPMLPSIGASSVVAPARGVQKMIQISSSIPNGASHPSSPYGPKYAINLITVDYLLTFLGCDRNDDVFPSHHQILTPGVVLLVVGIQQHSRQQ